VVAPAFIPPQPGARVQTNRRDVIKLVRPLRSGDLPPVHVPRVEDDALRALRGVQLTMAMTTGAELGDLTRFDIPPSSSTP
jgi:hypothetical protein